MKMPTSLIKIVSKSKVFLSKNSPEIFLGAGIIAIVGGTVWACKASRKLDAIFDELDCQIENVDDEYSDELKEYIDSEKGENFTKAEGDKELAALDRKFKIEKARVTFATAGEIVREFAPSVILISGGIGMIIQGHRILNARVATAMAAYRALDTTFKDYRCRVVERYGEDIENDIYTGTTYTKETRTEIDENGKKKRVTDMVPIVGTTVSPYAKFFDEASSKEWTHSPDYNHTFLICQQNAANDKLRREGYLFLNTVYKMLGMQETPTGAICGWILPKDKLDRDPIDGGDDYVDFGIFDPTDPNKRAFVNGDEPSILLDFNCQGVIYDLI